MKHLLLTTIAAVVLVGTAFADPIHDAAKFGDLDGVQAELDKGVDVNAKDDHERTALHFATSRGHKEVAELLIAKGADVNAKDKYERTPLHGVTTKEIAGLLIAKGADANAAMKNGRTALDMTKRHPEIADLLRKHGAKTGEELKAAGK